MSKGSQQFFEVFRRDPSALKKTIAKETKKVSVGGAQEPSWVRSKERGSVSPQPTKATVVPLWPARSQPSVSPGVRRGWTFSTEMLVITGVALAVLMVAAHSWGYVRGSRKRLAAELASFGEPAQSQKSVAHHSGAQAEAMSSRPANLPLAVPTEKRSAEKGRTTASAETAQTEAQPFFYTLRVMDGVPQKNAEIVVKELREEGYNAFYSSSATGRGCAVNVGRFAREDDPQAIKLREEFENKVYRGSKQFSRCYIVRMVKR